MHKKPNTLNGLIFNNGPRCGFSMCPIRMKSEIGPLTTPNEKIKNNNKKVRWYSSYLIYIWV